MTAPVDKKSSVHQIIQAVLDVPTQAINTNTTIATSIAVPVIAELSNGVATYEAARSDQFPAVLGQTTKAGSTSVTIASDQPAIPTLQNSMLIPVAHDYIGVNLVGATSDVYTYKTGGAGGTTVATLTIVYSGVDKSVISSIART